MTVTLTDSQWKDIVYGGSKGTTALQTVITAITDEIDAKADAAGAALTGTTTAATITATGVVTGASFTGDKTILNIENDTDTLALTAAAHAGKLLTISDASLAMTLPEATGTGDVYEFIMLIDATAVTLTTADTSNAGYYGTLSGSDTDDSNPRNWSAVAGTSDTVTLNGAATGGKIGDIVRVRDIATDKWQIEGRLTQSGGSEATPFSSAA